MKTKILGLLLTLLVAVTSLPAGTTAQAVENEAAEVRQERSEESLGATEAEIKAGAVALTSGVAKTDRLTKAVEEKWYKFVVPDTTGYTTIQFVKQDVEVSGNWSVQVFKENNLSNVYYEWGVDSKLITEKVTYEPGTWYLKVKGRWNVPEDVDYSILTSFVTDDSYEKECNDTKEKACALISDKTYHGRISRSDSEDWYKYTATDKGYFIVNFAPGEQGVPGGTSAWKFIVYNAGLEQIYEQSYVKGEVTTYKIPCRPGVYYVKVMSMYSTTIPNEEYLLKIAFTKSAVIEGEPNNTYQQADTIKTGVTYTGALQHGNDEDWYRLKLTSEGVALFKFSRSSNTSPDEIGWGWKIDIYKGTSAAPIQTLATKDVTTYKLTLKKGTYYIRIYPNLTGKPINKDYSIKVNYAKTPKTVKLKSVTAGKRRATIKWNKSKDATGYYIYRSTKKNSGYKKIATIKKNKTVKYVDKKSLKSKRIYYYKVVAYKKTNGLV